MTINYCGKVWLLAISFFAHSMVLHASDKAAGTASSAPSQAPPTATGAGQTPAPAKAEATPAPTPTPTPIRVNRFVSLPEFRVFTWDQKLDQDPARLEKQVAAAKVYDYESARFTLVVALASWSSRATELAGALNAWQPKLKTRGVKIVGIFTHDSLIDIVTVAKKQNLTFPLAKVSLDFVSKLLNPKVPTLWIVDHSGYVVYRKERPTDREISEAKQFLLDWTDF